MSGWWKLSGLVICVLIFFAPLPPVYAKAVIFLTQAELSSLNFTGYESINPNQLIYPLKRVQEDLLLNLTFNKVDQDRYRYQLLDKRFKELVYIINYDKNAFLFEDADRYNTAVGKVNKDFLTKNGNQKTKISDSIKILEKLRDRYHSGSPYWVKIQETIDSSRRLI